MKNGTLLLQNCTCSWLLSGLGVGLQARAHEPGSPALLNQPDFRMAEVLEGGEGVSCKNPTQAALTTGLTGGRHGKGGAGLCDLVAYDFFLAGAQNSYSLWRKLAAEVGGERAVFAASVVRNQWVTKHTKVLRSSFALGSSSQVISECASNLLKPTLQASVLSEMSKTPGHGALGPHGALPTLCSPGPDGRWQQPLSRLGGI